MKHLYPLFFLISLFLAKSLFAADWIHYGDDFDPDKHIVSGNKCADDHWGNRARLGQNFSMRDLGTLTGSYSCSGLKGRKHNSVNRGDDFYLQVQNAKGATIYEQPKATYGGGSTSPNSGPCSWSTGECNSVWADTVSAGEKWFVIVNYFQELAYNRGSPDGITLNNGKNFTDPYMDLAGLDFTDVDLSNANFSGADLSGTIFINANLTNTIFTDAELAGVNLTNATLDDNQLDDALFNGTTGMEAALASGVILTGTVYAASMNYSDVVNNDVSPAGLDLTGQDFSDYDLSSLDFTDAELAGGIFTNATISDDQLDVALFNGVSGVDAAIDSGAIFTNTYSSYEVGQNYNDVVNNDVSPAGLDLTGQDFSQYDLTGLDFTDAELGGAIFTDAELAGVNLTNATLDDNQLDDALFNGTTGMEAALASGVIFTGTVYEASVANYQVSVNYSDVVNNGVSPAGLDLTGQDFSQYDLTGLDFTDAELGGAIFNDAIITDDQLDTALFEGVSGTNAALVSGATFNLTSTSYEVVQNSNDVVKNNVSPAGLYLVGANFIDDDLSGKDFTGANLADARFNRANLTGTIFTDATLTGAKFNRAKLIDADLSGSILTGAVLNRTNLAGAVFNGATITNGMINSRRFRNANLVGVIVISD